jgi:squalene-hopene/tetraprenyl-beta-curcumene cyclase
VLECLGHHGYTTQHLPVRKAIHFLHGQQDRDGCWQGRWGVNYIYGTWQVLTGLRSVGERMEHHYVRRAANWLRSCQKADGSWGETCESYDDPTLKGTGHSTPSQTAWGAMGLMAVVGPTTPSDPDIRRAIEYLVRHQRPDGNWDEMYYTGTGFPRVFYLKYHLYRLYFPLTALARFGRLSR